MTVPPVDFPFGPFVPRPENPVLRPGRHDYERYGCEDPRVVLVDGTYYLTYTGWDRHTAWLCLATSTDLRRWDKHIHLATSDDLLHWKADPEPVLRPEPGTFMGDLVESGRSRSGRAPGTCC
ncbi:hypothetical protein [Kribbella sp. NPDC003557]|uniref:glycoside hydrolase family 130 protein n=1 Tax=Kribbella sp. NPDC003557 TaxID=3154449 RepID=UPI0033A7BC2F